MKTLTTSALALALVACGNNKQSSPTAGQDPKAPVIANAKGPAPDPTTPVAVPTEPTFASLVNTAAPTSKDSVDAKSLGAAVDAYVITRYGAAGNHDEQAQQFDVSLVLFGGGKAIRVDLGAYEDLGDTRPFGDMTADAAFGGRTYDADTDAFTGAPKWKSKAPILFATAPHDISGDTEAYVITHEKDSLVVWHAYNAWEDSSSEKWEKDTTIALAKDAAVATPSPVIGPPSATGTVHLIDDLVSEGKGYRWYTVSLQLGDRVGPVGTATVKTSEDEAWVIGASTDGLPGPLPQADAFLAHRVYSESATQAQRLLLGRVGDELFLWSHWVLGQPDADWREPQRIALAPGAKLEVR